jgi:antitoxin (DNA-binding transcriptional repressor) of toxin-antitoxin stability system
VIITERNRPVAQIQPIAEPEPGARDSRLAALQHSGVLLPPAGKPLDVEVFLSAPRPTLSRTKGLVAAVLAEREEGR